MSAVLLFTPVEAVTACCVDVHQARVCGRPHLQYGSSGVAEAAYQAPACFPCASFPVAEILGTTVGIGWLWVRRALCGSNAKRCSAVTVCREQLSGNEPEPQAYGQGCSGGGNVTFLTQHTEAGVSQESLSRAGVQSPPTAGLSGHGEGCTWLPWVLEAIGFQVCAPGWSFCLLWAGLAGCMPLVFW